MPNRILRDGILKSKPVNSLTAPAEVFYRRLMSVVDDFGRYEADPSILRPECYPLQLERVREADLVRLLAECEKADLIRLYEIDGKQYLWMLKTDPPRAISSKYPPHPNDSRTCKVLRAHADACAHVRPYSYSSSGSHSESLIPPNPPQAGGVNGNGRRVRESKQDRKDREKAQAIAKTVEALRHAGN